MLAAYQRSYTIATMIVHPPGLLALPNLCMPQVIKPDRPCKLAAAGKRIVPDKYHTQRSLSTAIAARRARQEATKLAMPLPVRRKTMAVGETVETCASSSPADMRYTPVSSSSVTSESSLRAAKINFLCSGANSTFVQAAFKGLSQGHTQGLSEKTCDFTRADNLFKMLNINDFVCPDDLFKMLDRDFLPVDTELSVIGKEITFNLVSSPAPQNISTATRCSLGHTAPSEADHCTSSKGKKVRWAGDRGVESDVLYEDTVEWNRMKKSVYHESEVAQRQHDKRIQLERYAASMSPTRRRCQASSAHVQRMRAAQARSKARK